MLYTQRCGDWRSIEGQHSCKHTHRKRLQTAEEVYFIHPYSPYGDASILIIDSRCHALTAAERGHGDKISGCFVRILRILSVLAAAELQKQIFEFLEKRRKQQGRGNRNNIKNVPRLRERVRPYQIHVLINKTLFLRGCIQ